MANETGCMALQNLERRVKMLEQAISDRDPLYPFSDDPACNTDRLVDAEGEFITKTRAAEILCVTRATVYAMLEDGRIKGACSGSKVDTRSIARYIFSRGKKGKRHEDHA